jgi:predicted neuraminidase
MNLSIKKLAFLGCTFLIVGNITAQNMWKKTREELILDNPPFKECHASTLVQTQTGELLISFFGGSEEGEKDVAIWLCNLTGGNKTNLKMVADGVIDNTTRYPAWNPVLFQVNTGKLLLFYKVGPNPREWWGMVKTSNDNGLSWSGPKQLAKGILGPIKNKPVQLKDGTILSPSSTEENWGKWKVHIETSSDLGDTWSLMQIDTTAAFDVIQPSILEYAKDSLQILCRSKQGNVVQAWSGDNGKTWGPLSKTSLLNPNSGIDAVTLKSGKQVIVYNPELPGKEWYNGRGKLRVAYSLDGRKWKDVAILEDGTKEEYSYPAIIQSRDGLIHITYTYDRKNIKYVVLEEGD